MQVHFAETVVHKRRGSFSGITLTPLTRFKFVPDISFLRACEFTTNAAVANQFSSCGKFDDKLKSITRLLCLPIDEHLYEVADVFRRALGPLVIA